MMLYNGVTSLFDLIKYINALQLNLLCYFILLSQKLHVFLDNFIHKMMFLYSMGNNASPRVVSVRSEKIIIYDFELLTVHFKLI